MKFFHLSDLHIGIRLVERDMGADQRFIFEQIAAMAEREQPDAILIAGDIYNNAAPSAEAVDMFDRFISSLIAAAPDAEIMVISGNHDSMNRIDLFRSVLSRQKVRMIGKPPRDSEDHIEKVTLTDEFGKVDFYLLPFVSPSMIRNIVGTDESGRNLSYDKAVHALIEREELDQENRSVIVSHQFYVPTGSDPANVERMGSELPKVGNVDAVYSDALDAFDYAALGHIHKPSVVGRETCRYCGTPAAYSVSEAGQEKGVVMVEMKQKGETDISVMPLEPLHRVGVFTGPLDELLERGCDDYAYIVLEDDGEVQMADAYARLRIAFPNCIRIERRTERKADYSAVYDAADEPDAFELCRAFLGDDLTDEESQLLMSVIDSVQEAAL